MRAPLLVPALVFLAATVVARDFSFGDGVVLAFVAVAAVLFGRTPAHLVAAVAVAVGLALGAWRGNPPRVAHEILGMQLRGIVASERIVHPWGDAFELLADDGLRYSVALRKRVALGERLVARGRLEPFDEPRNPDEPSSRELAAERGLAAHLADARLVARAPPDSLDLRTLAARLREAAGARLHRFLGEPDATILAGMLYGARGTLPEALRAEFQDTGTVHVLVTAGLHLGVIAALAAFILDALGCGRVASSLLAIPLVWSYAIVSGGHVPSLRAATMATVALGARALGERSISLNALAFAAIVVGAIWPAWVGGASFALSFSCVGAIVLFAEPLSELFAGVPRLAREALALTLATQIGVWPLTAATFLTIAPYAPLANVLVVPVVGVALAGGFVLLVLSPFPALAALAARIEAWPLAWIANVVHLTARLPYAHVVATPPPLWAIALYDLAAIAAATLLRRA